MAWLLANRTLMVSTRCRRDLCFSYGSPERVSPDSGSKAAAQVAIAVQEPIADDDKLAASRAAAKSILPVSGQKSGFCLLLGSAEGRLGLELVAKAI